MKRCTHLVKRVILTGRGSIRGNRDKVDEVLMLFLSSFVCLMGTLEEVQD